MNWITNNSRVISIYYEMNLWTYKHLHSRFHQNFITLPTHNIWKMKNTFLLFLSLLTPMLVVSQSNELITIVECPSSPCSCLLIGMTLPLTGRLSPEGRLQMNGVKLWGEQLNVQGLQINDLVAFVEIVALDDKSDTSLIPVRIMFLSLEFFFLDCKILWLNLGGDWWFSKCMTHW